MPATVAVRAALRAPAGSGRRRERLDAVAWLAVVAAGLVVTSVAVTSGADVHSAGAPFTGHYRLRLTAGSLLAPLVAVAVLAAVRRGAHERLPWARLLALGWLAATAWAVSLALVDGGAGLARPLAPALHDLRLVGDHPAGFLRHFVADAARQRAQTREQPPGSLLFVWALGRAGIHGAVLTGVVVTAIGCLAVPLAAVAVRSLCHEPAARRLVPVLVLAPYAVWVAVSLDAVALAVAAGALACGVIGSERGRSLWWALGCGALLGAASLLSYGAAWLACSVIVVYFVRRRAALNVVTGAATLLPLWLAWLAGFTWSDGVASAHRAFTASTPGRSGLVWAGLDLLVVVIAAGPAIAPAARKVTNTPGWPFLVGAVLAVGFSVASGLSRGEVERSFLPFLPWLLVPAVAPERRPDRPGSAAAAPTPVLLTALAAATAILVEAVLVSPW